MMDGIEVTNQGNYYPEAHKWLIDKNLTFMSNTDIHDPAGTEYELYNKERRSFTVVFAKDRSIPSIKEALKNRRTVAYWNNTLAGDKKYLMEIFNKSVSFDKTTLELVGRKSRYVQITNNSSIDYVLTAVNPTKEFDIPDKIVLTGGKTVLFRIYSVASNINDSQEVSFPYLVENLLLEPNKGMQVDIKFKIKRTASN